MFPVLLLVSFSLQLLILLLVSAVVEDWIMWQRLLVYVALSLLLVNEAKTHEQDVVDPIRNALGFWGRLLNRMAQPRLPSDDEVRFSVDDFDLEKLEQLLKKDSGAKFGGKNVGDERKIQQLLKSNKKFNSSNLASVKTTTKAPKHLAKKVKKPNRKNIINESKKNSTHNNNTNENFDEHFDNPTAKALFKLAKQELEEEEKSKKKQNKLTTTLAPELNASTIEEPQAKASTTTVARINPTTTAATSDNATRLNDVSAKEIESTTKPFFQINTEDPQIDEDNVAKIVDEKEQSLLSSAVQKSIITDDESEENLYLEQELRKRMKYFEEVENVLLNELGSGEELPDENYKLESLIKKMFTSNVEETAANGTANDSIFNFTNQTVSYDNKATNPSASQKNSTKSHDSSQSSKKITNVTVKTTVSGNITNVVEGNSTETAAITASSSTTTVPVTQPIPDAEEEDPSEKVTTTTTTSTTTSTSTSTSTTTAGTTTTTTATTANADSNATATTEFPPLNGSSDIRRKETNLSGNPDEKAALRPVEKIVDGIGPLILPLLGYGHDAPIRFYPYLQAEKPAKQSKEAFTNPKTLPEDILGVSTAIASQLARSYLAEQSKAKTQKTTTTTAASPPAASYLPLPISAASAVLPYFQSGPLLPLLSAAAPPPHPYVASAGRTLNPAPPSPLSYPQNAAEDSRAFQVNSESNMITSTGLDPRDANYWPDDSSINTQSYERHRQRLLSKISKSEQLKKHSVKIPFRPLPNTHTTETPIRVYPEKYNKKSNRKAIIEKKYIQQQAQKQRKKLNRKPKRKSLKSLNTTSLRRRYLPNPTKQHPSNKPDNSSSVSQQKHNSAAIYCSTKPIASNLDNQYGNNFPHSSHSPQIYATYPEPFNSINKQNPSFLADTPLHPIFVPVQSTLFSPKMAEKIAASVAAALPGYQDIYDKKEDAKATSANSDGDTPMFGNNKQKVFAEDSGIISSTGSNKLPDGFSESFMLQGNSIGISGGDNEKKLLI
uniref:PAM2 domain-containing protein n=1 Tax=Syphacia muris TaxID=451379 RepID=A0A0N5ARU5_9BILA